VADGVVLNAGSGGATMATDDDGTFQHQYVKLEFGPDNTFTKVTSTSGLPVELLASSAEIGNVANSGTFAVQIDGAALTALQLIDNAVSGSGFNISQFAGATVPIGAGVEATALRVTLATDSTGVVSIDDNGGALTVDNAGTFATQATLQANSGVDIGDVDVISVIPGTGATNLGKAEDAAHTTGDVGVMALGVRNDTLSSLSGADGDYSPVQVNALGAVYTNAASKESTANSSTSLLGVSGTFTGTSEDLLGYVSVNVMVKADVASAAGGLSLEFSTDGTNWDFAQTYTVSAGTTFAILTRGKGRYFRVVYTNGGTGQAYFRLKTLLKSTAVSNEYLRLDVPLSDASEAAVSRAVLAAKKPDTSYSNVEATASGNLKVSIEESATLTVDGSGVTQPVEGVSAENAAASGNPVLAGGRYDVTPRTLGDGDVGALALDVNGHLIANPHADSVAFADGVSNTESVVVDEMGNFVIKPVFGHNFNGTTWDRIRGDATNGLLVNLGSNNDVTVSGTVTVDGSGVTQPVSGTVTANLSATDNAVIDNIQTAVEIIDNSVFADDAAFTLASSSVTMAGAIRDDALATLTAVEGDAVPLRVSSTGALHVTGGGGGTQYNVDDAAPTVVTMAGVVRDDSLTTLTEADGDATLLRVSSTGALHVTGGGGGTEYTEDVATPATIVGTATMMERDDALSALTPVEGDWASLRCNANGALWTEEVNASTIAGDTTSIDGKITACDTGAVVISSGTVTANLGATDNAVLDAIEVDTTSIATDASTIAGDTTEIAGNFLVDAGALGKGILIQGDDGTDRKNINVDATTGDVQVDVTNTVTVDGSGVTQPVSGTVTANLSATDNAVLDSIDSAVNGTLTVGSHAVTNAGTFATQATLQTGSNVIGALTANQSVNVAQMNGVATTMGNGASGTGVQRVTIASDSTGVIIANGGIAHDGADSGNPVKVGGKAYNSDGTVPGTAVVEGDRANFITDLYGRQYVDTVHPNYWRASVDYAAAQTNATIKAAPGAGLKLYITDVIISNGATAGNITLLDGSGGTVLLEAYPAITGGLTHSFRTPLALTANTLLAITSTTVTTHSVTVSGYTAP